MHSPYSPPEHDGRQLLPPGQRAEPTVTPPVAGVAESALELAADGVASARRLPYVLVVDDTPLNCHLLECALRGEYKVRVASNGVDALAMLHEQEKPDLVLLDIMMPGMDGYEVCQRVKEDPELKGIPLIFVTAMDQPEDQQRGFALGAVDYITKPFELPLVKARVNVHVRLKLKSEMLEKLAFVDGLTDIPNRRALEETLKREWGRASRRHDPLSVLMIDIDVFKAYNDRCGHGAGDLCLRRVAHELVRGLQRPGDFVGRYGGEEFLAILPNCDAAGALRVGESLRSRIADLRIPHPASSVADIVTISVGFTSHQVGPETPPVDLESEADEALYLAKSGGRNRVCAFAGRAGPV